MTLPNTQDTITEVDAVNNILPKRFRLWNKVKGGHAKQPPMAPIKAIMIAWIGGVIGIAVIGLVTDYTHYPFVLGSLGATCVLVFGFPESPFSQPRNIIGGHFLSSLMGLLFISVLGVTWWSTALALATAIAVMQLTKTVHPPAGSNPVIIMLTHATWPFLLTPTLVGATTLCVVAFIFHTIMSKKNYPTYWL